MFFDAEQTAAGGGGAYCGVVTKRPPLMTPGAEDPQGPPVGPVSTCSQVTNAAAKVKHSSHVNVLFVTSDANKVLVNDKIKFRTCDM